MSKIKTKIVDCTDQKKDGKLSIDYKALDRMNTHRVYVKKDTYICSNIFYPYSENDNCPVYKSQPQEII